MHNDSSTAFDCVACLLSTACTYRLSAIFIELCTLKSIVCIAAALRAGLVAPCKGRRQPIVCCGFSGAGAVAQHVAQTIQYMLYSTEVSQANST